MNENNSANCVKCEKLIIGHSSHWCQGLNHTDGAVLILKGNKSSREHSFDELQDPKFGLAHAVRPFCCYVRAICKAVHGEHYVIPRTSFALIVNYTSFQSHFFTLFTDENCDPCMDDFEKRLEPHSVLIVG